MIFSTIHLLNLFSQNKHLLIKYNQLDQILFYILWLLFYQFFIGISIEAIKSGKKIYKFHNKVDFKEVTTANTQPIQN